MLKDITEEMPNNVTEIFVTITEAVKNLMPLITLTKPTVFAFLKRSEYFKTCPFFIYPHKNEHTQKKIH